MAKRHAAAIAALSGIWQPSQNGLKAATGDPQAAGTSVTLAGGYPSFRKLQLEDPAAISNLIVFCGNTASGLTAGQCFGGVYSAAGVLLGKTADLSSGVFNTTGLKTMALTAESGQSLPSGAAGAWVHVVLLFNGTTPPQLAGYPGPNALDAGLSTLTTNSRSAHNGSGGLTALPSSRPSLTPDVSRVYWAALS